MTKFSKLLVGEWGGEWGGEGGGGGFQCIPPSSSPSLSETIVSNSLFFCRLGSLYIIRYNEQQFSLPHDFIILFPFQDPQGTEGTPTPAKRCRLATLKMPAFETAMDPPSPKRSVEVDEISISLTKEEERHNLVSPLLTSKFTVSVLNVAWHSFPNPKFVIKTSVSTYYLWPDCTFVSSCTHARVMITGKLHLLSPPPHIATHIAQLLNCTLCTYSFPGPPRE